MSGLLLILGVAGLMVTGWTLNRLVERSVKGWMKEVGAWEPTPGGRPLVAPRYRREPEKDDEAGEGCPLCGEDHRRSGFFVHA